MGLVVRTISAQSALTPTGGFLAEGPEGGFTHSFNPAIGCGFARGLCGDYCYARGFAERLGGRGTWGERLLVKTNAAEVLQDELERASARPSDHPLHVRRLRIFSASSTDPCAKPVLELYRRCLSVAAAFPIACWVIQTRSPLVVSLAKEVQDLGERAVLSFTLETDDETLWRSGPAGAPGISARRRAFESLSHWPVRRNLAVAPLLPLKDPEAFARWIAEHATDAIVDTFPSGDGSHGRRTASSPLPAWLARKGSDWRDEREARAFHARLRGLMGERAGWSREGFARLSAR
jgi:DNA repair photolyase